MTFVKKMSNEDKKRRFVALFDIVGEDVERKPPFDYQISLIVCNYSEIKWLCCLKFIMYLVYNYTSSFK